MVIYFNDWLELSFKIWNIIRSIVSASKNCEIFFFGGYRNAYIFITRTHPTNFTKRKFWWCSCNSMNPPHHLTLTRPFRMYILQTIKLFERGSSAGMYRQRINASSAAQCYLFSWKNLFVTQRLRCYPVWITVSTWTQSYLSVLITFSVCWWLTSRKWQQVAGIFCSLAFRQRAFCCVIVGSDV
jgi:hypothetical protein